MLTSALCLHNKRTKNLGDSIDCYAYSVQAFYTCIRELGTWSLVCEASDAYAVRCSLT